MAMADARPKSNIGINKMVVATPGLSLSPEALADVIGRDQHMTRGKDYQKMREKLRGDILKEHPMIFEWEIDEHVNPAIEPALIADNVGKIRSGLGVDMIRMPGYSESNVTFVANMLYDFVKRLGSDRESLHRLEETPVKTIYYATESNPDRSRPELEPALLLAGSKLFAEDETKYRPIIEMLREASVVPITFACVGGVVAINEAISRVRFSAENGHKESAVVITADTACYDSKKAPGAEATQGAAGTLMWITKDPNFIEIFDRSGRYHMPLSDFTKFVDETPVVHGRFSEIVYVYTVGKALQILEREYMSLDASNERARSAIMDEIGFFVCHVPFPKQAIYLTSFLFAHEMKRKNPELFAAMQMRKGVGREPLPENMRLTDLIEAKFRMFNTNGHGKQHESAVIDYIETDPEIRAYWDWLKKFRETPEFEAFLKKLHIKEALKLPSIVGNSYTGSSLISMVSLALHSVDLDALLSSIGLLAGYGSGAQSIVIPIKLLARRENIFDHLTLDIDMDNRYPVTPEAYRELHPIHLQGDSARLTSGENLVEKDLKLLRSQTLPKGFHIIRRNVDGTGEYAYSDGKTIEPVTIRF